MTLKYLLPKFPSEGKWTIRVEALSQVYDHYIIVERFYYRFFDVSRANCFLPAIEFDDPVQRYYVVENM